MKAAVRATAVVLTILAGAGLGGHAGAQPSAVPPTLPGGTVVQGDVVEGRISRVEQGNRTITLDNGQDYLLPSPLVPNWDILRTGAAVKIRYSVDGGRNFATYVEVRPAS
jgi:hypothetical protein